MVKGQALLVVLLIMGVVVTVALSVVSRSVTEVNISTTEDQSARALQAAEAGVEQTLGGLITGTGTANPTPIGSGNNAKYNVVKTSLGGISGVNNYYRIPYLVDAGDTVTVNLYTSAVATPLGLDTPSDLMTVCWGKTTGADSSTNLAIEAILYYQKKIGTDLVWVVGRNGYVVGATGGFYNAASGTCPFTQSNGNAFKFRTDISYRTMPLFTGAVATDVVRYLKLRVINNTEPQPIAVQPDNGIALPIQGDLIESVGSSGDTVQKIKAADPKTDLPFMFDAAFFSGGPVTLN